MKRLFAILLSALLCAAALVGCAPAEPAESPAPSETPAAGAPEEEGVYTPGTYTGEAQGYGGVVTVNKERCIGCKGCLAIGCPAISIHDKKAVIDYTQCVGCGVCEGLCPKHAITAQEAAQ